MHLILFYLLGQSLVLKIKRFTYVFIFCPPAALVPCPNLYAQLNALQLVLDPRSLVWINLFALDLRQSLEQFMEIYKLNDSQKPEEHIDIKIDGLMLKVSWKR